MKRGCYARNFVRNLSRNADASQIAEKVSSCNCALSVPSSDTCPNTMVTLNLRARIVTILTGLVSFLSARVCKSPKGTLGTRLNLDT